MGVIEFGWRQGMHDKDNRNGRRNPAPPAFGQELPDSHAPDCHAIAIDLRIQHIANKQPPHRPGKTVGKHSAAAANFSAAPRENNIHILQVRGQRLHDVLPIIDGQHFDPSCPERHVIPE